MKVDDYMIKKILPNNELILSNDFQKEKYKFDLIIKNFKKEDVELYSDEKNYFICRAGKQWPAWIWNKDNLNEEILNSIEECIEYYLNDNNSTKFVCKKELYDLLVKNNYKYLFGNSFEMGFLLCERTINPKECDGFLRKATTEDIDIISKYMYDDYKEMIVEDLTFDEARNEAEELIKLNILDLWINNEGKIVSMAHCKEKDGQAKISTVYTPKEERRKGYATNLIYNMTNEQLEKGNVPLLYTDYNYIASNECYKKVGYKDEGTLINFYCKR